MVPSNEKASQKISDWLFIDPSHPFEWLGLAYLKSDNTDCGAWFAWASIAVAAC